MSAKSLEVSQTPETPDNLVHGIGSVAMPWFKDENIIFMQQDQDMTIDLPATQTPEGASARTFAIAATLIKEKFQALPANLKADERDVRRAQIREDSVRTIFKTFKMLPNTADVDKPFSELFGQVETRLAEVEKSRLADLYDKYEHHPVIVVIDRLANDQSIAKIPPEDFVFMRRVSLLLIEGTTA